MKKQTNKKALIVVDMQNDFLPGGTLPVSEGDTIIPLINQLLKLPFDLKVATQDWHPKNHISFASTHGKKAFEILQIDQRLQHLWEDHCIQDTFGAELSKKIDLDKIIEVFQKGIREDVDSYSAFFDDHHLKSTGLFDFLKEKEVSEIYVVGIALEYCVKHTVLDALKLGFKVHVILDATKAVNVSSSDDILAIEEMKRAGAIMEDSKNIFESSLLSVVKKK